MVEFIGQQDNIEELITRLQTMEGMLKLRVFTTAPTLAQMDVGEMAIGDGSEASPDAGSNAIYYKPDETKIVVNSTAAAGGSQSQRHIT